MQRSQNHEFSTLQGLSPDEAIGVGMIFSVFFCGNHRGTTMTAKKSFLNNLRPTRTGVLGWALMTIALGAYVAANMLDLWDAYPWYDRIMHPFTGFAITIMIGNFLYPKIFRRPGTHPVFLIFAIASLGVMAGVIWEIYEWIREFYTPTDTVKGKLDTMIDIVLDMVGSILGAIIVLTMQSKRANRNRKSTPRRMSWENIPAGKPIPGRRAKRS